MSFLNSPVQTAVEKATAETLPGSQDALNRKVCSLINTADNGPRDALKTMRKRLKHKSPKVQLLTLHLLDSAVHQCTAPFHDVVASRDFLKELSAIATSLKHERQVQDRIVELMHFWATAFAQTRQHAAFKSAFDALKSSGMAIPAINPRKPKPIYMHTLTPERGVRDDFTPPRNASPGVDVEKMMTDLTVVRDNVQLMDDMLGNGTGSEVTDNDLVRDLAKTLEQMRARVQRLIEDIPPEELLDMLLAVHDEVKSVLDRYRAMQALPAAPAPAPAQQASPPDLLGLTPDSEPAAAAPVAAASAAADEDEFAALAKRSFSPPPAASSAAAPVPAPATSGNLMGLEDDFDSMAMSRAPQPQQPPAMGMPHAPETVSSPPPANSGFAGTNGNPFGAPAFPSQQQQPQAVFQQQQQQQQHAGAVSFGGPAQFAPATATGTNPFGGSTLAPAAAAATATTTTASASSFLDNEIDAFLARPDPANAKQQTTPAGGDPFAEFLS